MADAKQQVSPVTVISGGGAILAGLATAAAWTALYERHVARIAERLDPDWLDWLYTRTAINWHFPGTLSMISRVPWLHWALDYVFVWLVPAAVVAVVASSVAAWAFEKDPESLLLDPEFDDLHRGLDTPAYSHIDPIVAVLPEDADLRGLAIDILLGDIDPRAPESVSSEMKEIGESDE